MRPFKTNFSLLERDLIARAAGRVFDAAQIDSSRPDKARTGASRPPGYPRRPQQQDRAPAALVSGAIRPYIRKMHDIPPEVATAVAEFLSAGRTRNIQLNIKDGKILGAHVEEFISFKTAERPAAVNGARRGSECLNRI